MFDPLLTIFNPPLDIVFIAFQFWVLGMSIVAVSSPSLNFRHTLTLTVSRSSTNPSHTSLRLSSHTWLPPVSQSFVNAAAQLGSMATRLGSLSNRPYQSIPERFLSFDHQWRMPWNQSLTHILGSQKSRRDRQSGLECPRSIGSNGLILEADKGISYIFFPLPPSPLIRCRPSAGEHSSALVLPSRYAPNTERS